MTSTMDNDMRDKARDAADEAKDMVSEGGAVISDGARDLARKARVKAENAADHLTSASRDTMETASGRLKASARDAAAALSDAAGEISHVVGDEVSRRAGEVRDVIADKSARVTDSLRDIADRNDLASLPTRAVDTAVDAVSSVADRVTGKSFGALLDDVTDFARRRPVATAVGVAATAFVVMRLIRSSGQDTRAAAMPKDEHRATIPATRPAESAAQRGQTAAARKPAARRPAASKA
jgi:hypothetical protein